MNKNMLLAPGLAIASGILLVGCGDSAETKQAKDDIIEPAAVHMAEVAIRNIRSNDKGKRFTVLEGEDTVTLKHSERFKFLDDRHTQRTQTILIELEKPDGKRFDPTTVSRVIVRDATCYEEEAGKFDCNSGFEGELDGPSVKLTGKADDQWGVSYITFVKLPDGRLGGSSADSVGNEPYKGYTMERMSSIEATQYTVQQIQDEFHNYLAR